MGTEVLTLNLAKGLTLKGHTVEIITGHHEYDLSHKHPPWMTVDQFEDIIVHRLHFGLSEWKANRYLAMYEPARIALIEKLVHDFNPDIVHFHHLIGFTAEIIPVIRGMGIPVFFTATDFWTICPRFTMFNARSRTVCANKDDPVDCLQCLKSMPSVIAKSIYSIAGTPLGKIHWKIALINHLRKRTARIVNNINCCNRIFLSTQFLKNILVQHGADGSRIHVVPYGINIGKLPEPLAIPKKFTEEKPFHIGFIGTLSDYKAPHTILDALSFLGEAVKNISISIYGNYIKNDPYNRILAPKLKNVEGIVQHKGTFPNEAIGSILRSLHALVIPSVWYESSPLVLVSALNAGVPVIVSNLGGMTEAIQGGNYGFSYEAGNPQKLAEVVLNIMKNPDILHTLKINLSEYKRTTGDYVSDIEKHYLEILLEQ